MNKSLSRTGKLFINNKLKKNSNKKEEKSLKFDIDFSKICRFGNKCKEAVFNFTGMVFQQLYKVLLGDSLLVNDSSGNIIMIYLR